MTETSEPAREGYLDRLGRQQLDEVMVALGPLYNDERHSWNVGTLARKAAADLASGTRADFDSATVGALARLVLAMDENRRDRDKLSRKLAEGDQLYVQACAANSGLTDQLEKIRAVASEWRNAGLTDVDAVRRVCAALDHAPAGVRRG